MGASRQSGTGRRSSAHCLQCALSAQSAVLQHFSGVAMTWTNNTPEHFWANVGVTHEDTCWEWKLWRDKDGYGHVRWNKKGVLAHRKAWELARGSIPDGLCVLHSCDNPPCCNPAHLHLGTNVENTRESVEKGRRATGNRNGSRRHPERLVRRFGDTNPAAKVVDSTIAAIRAAYVPGRVRQKDLARQFGVSQSYVSLVVREKCRVPSL